MAKFSITKCPHGKISEQQSVTRRDVFRAKCSHGKMSLRLNVLTSKSPYGDMYQRRKCLTAKIFTAKFSTVENPTTKTPTAKFPVAREHTGSYITKLSDPVNIYRGPFMLETINGCFFVSKPTLARPILVMSPTCLPYRSIIPIRNFHVYTN